MRWGPGLRYGILLVGVLLAVALVASEALAGTHHGSTAHVAPPRDVVRPSLSGTPAPGFELFAKRGRWTSRPSRFAFKWRVCSDHGSRCRTIRGQTKPHLRITSGEAHDTIAVIVTARNAAGARSVRSKPKRIAPHRPHLSSGEPKSAPTSGAGTTTTGTGTTTTGTGTTTTGTGTTTTGTGTTTTGTGTTTTGTGTTTTSHPSGPTLVSSPVIGGTAAYDNTLTASSGQWSGDPTGFSYQWSDCNLAGSHCVPIAGATSSNYVTDAGDLLNRIEVTVTATNASGSSAVSATTAPVAATGSGPDGIKVSRNELVNDAGDVLDLHGVNRSGTEYACIQGWGIFDGPSDAASIAAMQTWNIDIVRVPINEDCWLGINGVPSADAGANYINAIVSFVRLLRSYGMYAELSLMWAAPGPVPATYQDAAPDEDHSPATWTGMAKTFAGYKNVILAPWGETVIGYPCFLTGCNNAAVIGANPGDGDATCGTNCWYYTTAGMQQAVNVMRAAGYSGPISIPCIDYANVCANPLGGGAYGNGTWLTEIPSDPDAQLIAEAHVYGGNLCDDATCFATTMSPILAAGYPMIFGETGENISSSDCGDSDIQPILQWADSNDVGYEAWAWDTWGGCSSLITNYDSATPANTYGTYIRSLYLSRGNG